MDKFKYLIALSLILAAPVAQAQSRISSQTQPVNRIWLDRPSELSHVSQLLNNGQREEALEIAEGFARAEMTGPFRYESLNVLCIAQTSNGLIDDALESCNKAITLRPSTWIAYNSRGGAHFAAGDYASAIEDYTHALKLYPKSEIIKFNLALAQSKQGS